LRAGYFRALINKDSGQHALDRFPKGEIGNTNEKTKASGSFESPLRAVDDHRGGFKGQVFLSRVGRASVKEKTRNGEKRTQVIKSSRQEPLQENKKY